MRRGLSAYSRPMEALKPCGTAGAARRHRYWRQPVCGPCKAAEDDERRAYQNARKRQELIIMEGRLRYLAVESPRAVWITPLPPSA